MSIYSQNITDRDSGTYSKTYGRPSYDDRPEWSSSYSRGRGGDFGNREERTDFRFSRSRWGGEREMYRNEMSPSPKRRRLRDDMDPNYHKAKRPLSSSSLLSNYDSYRPSSSYYDSSYRSSSSYDPDSSYLRREYEYDRDPLPSSSTVSSSSSSTASASSSSSLPSSSSTGINNSSVPPPPLPPPSASSSATQSGTTNSSGTTNLNGTNGNRYERMEGRGEGRERERYDWYSNRREGSARGMKSSALMSNFRESEGSYSYSDSLYNHADRDSSYSARDFHREKDRDRIHDRFSRSDLSYSSSLPSTYEDRYSTSHSYSYLGDSAREDRYPSSTHTTLYSPSLSSESESESDSLPPLSSSSKSASSRASSLLSASGNGNGKSTNEGNAESENQGQTNERENQQGGEGNEETTTPTPKKRLGWGKGLVAHEKKTKEPSPNLENETSPPPLINSDSIAAVSSTFHSLQSSSISLDANLSSLKSEKKEEEETRKEERKGEEMEESTFQQEAEEVSSGKAKEETRANEEEEEEEEEEREDKKEPKHTKEEIVQNIEQLEYEMNQMEQTIQDLKKPKKNGSDSLKHSSFLSKPSVRPSNVIQNILQENQQRIADFVEENSRFCFSHSPPLHNLTKEFGHLQIFQDNLNTHTCKGRIISRVIQNRVFQCYEKGRELTEQYKKMHETWKKKVVRMETKREKKEERKNANGNGNGNGNQNQNEMRSGGGEDMSEFGFHRRPVLRSTSATRSSITNSNSGLTRFGQGDSVRSEAEFDEIMNQLREEEKQVQRQDVFARYRATIAVVPNMILPEQKLPLFVNNNGIVTDPVIIERERKLVNPWTEEERSIFVESFLKFPKNFGEISSRLKKKSTREVVYFYYTNKKSLELKKLLREQQGKRRVGRGGRYNTSRDNLPTFINTSPPIDPRAPKPRNTANSALASATSFFPPKEEENLNASIRRTTSQNNLDSSLPHEETKKEKEKRVFWTEKEKNTFLKALKSYGKIWKKIAAEIPSKTPSQVKNYFQNYKNKLNLVQLLPSKKSDNEENDFHPSGIKKKTRRAAAEENKKRPVSQPDEEDEDSSSSEDENNNTSLNSTALSHSKLEEIDGQDDSPTINEVSVPSNEISENAVAESSDQLAPVLIANEALLTEDNMETDISVTQTVEIETPQEKENISVPSDSLETLKKESEAPPILESAEHNEPMDLDKS